MRTWLPAVVMGVAAIVAVGVVVAQGPQSTPAERADAVARELRCPDCQGLSVADSPTTSAAEIRRQVDELIASGASADDVRAHFVARYGEWILLAPSSPLLWIAPFAVALVAAAGLAVWLLRRRPPATARPGEPDDGVRRRLRDEAEALDA
jgi:cytochrome c-type biogenesis protein CcmH